MSYQTFAYAGKSPVKGDDIGPGQIELRHLSAALFSEIRSVQLHNHSGVGSKRIQLNDLEGNFPLTGFKMISADGTKWQVTMSNAGAFVITEIT